MYFLWRNQPKAALGVNREWILIADIPLRIENVIAFPTVDEARIVQIDNFAGELTSVLNQKTFLQKTNLKKLPAFQLATEGTQSSLAAKEMISYNINMEEFCDTVTQKADTVVFLPTNVKEAFETPLILQIKALMIDMAACIGALEVEESRLRDAIRYHDLLTVDRVHEVEMDCMTPDECVMFVSTMKKAQIQRRRCKNELTTVSIARSLLQDLELEDVKESLRKIEKLKKQEYHCRILTEEDQLMQRYKKKKTTG